MVTLSRNMKTIAILPSWSVVIEGLVSWNPGMPLAHWKVPFESHFAMKMLLAFVPELPESVVSWRLHWDPENIPQTMRDLSLSIAELLRTTDPLELIFLLHSIASESSLSKKNAAKLKLEPVYVTVSSVMSSPEYPPMKTCSSSTISTPLMNSFEDGPKKLSAQGEVTWEDAVNEINVRRSRRWDRNMVNCFGEWRLNNRFGEELFDGLELAFVWPQQALKRVQGNRSLKTDACIVNGHDELVAASVEASLNHH